MKQTVLLFLLFASTIICSAQEEVFFNNQNVNKKDIKVARLIHGFEFGVNYLRVLPTGKGGYEFGSVETHLNYFHESRLTNSWTLNKSVGITNAFYRTLNVGSGGIPSGVYESNYFKKQYLYNLSLNLELEPRWYFDQRQRYRENKTTLNNSGWFLSLPLMISTNLLSQPVVGGNSGWLPNMFALSIMAPPTIGYRNSFTENWFVEVSAGYIPLRATFYNGSFVFRSAQKVGLFSVDSFHSELKIAYTF
jgi:hypothetical protein